MRLFRSVRHDSRSESEADRLVATKERCRISTLSYGLKSETLYLRALASPARTSRSSSYLPARKRHREAVHTSGSRCLRKRVREKPFPVPLACLRRAGRGRVFPLPAPWPHPYNKWPLGLIIKPYYKFSLILKLILIILLI